MDKKTGGRPPKFNQETLDTIVRAIRGGNYVETAAAMAGVSKSTLYDWLKQGARAKTGKLKEFSDAVNQAQGEAEARDVLTIGGAAKLDWRAAAWRLERKFPDRWGRRDTMKHTGPGGGPIITANVDMSKLSVEELRTLEQLALKAAEDSGEEDI